MDYSEIIAVATDRVGNPNLPVRADLFTDLAEKALNKQLRTAAQETVVSFTTDVNGEYVLPTDFASIRTLSKGNYQMVQVNLADIKADSFEGFAFRGGSLITSHAETDMEMTYYAELPSLETNGTNWLSLSDPEIYIFAIMKQAYLGLPGAMDIERAQAASAYLGDLIMKMNSDDFVRRFKHARMTTGRVNP